jgi:hypothetical protein
MARKLLCRTSFNVFPPARHFNPPGSNVVAYRQFSFEGKRTHGVETHRQMISRRHTMLTKRQEDIFHIPLFGAGLDGVVVGWCSMLTPDQITPSQSIILKVHGVERCTQGSR